MSIKSRIEKLEQKTVKPGIKRYILALSEDWEETLNDWKQSNPDKGEPNLIILSDL